MASEQTTQETETMSGPEREQVFLNFLKFAGNPMANTDLRKILSLIVEPPQKTISINALQHYEQAQLQRKKKLMSRNDMMQDAEQSTINRDIYQYAVDRDKQMKINALQNI